MVHGNSRLIRKQAEDCRFGAPTFASKRQHFPADRVSCSGLLGSFHVHRAHKILNASAPALGALLSVFVVFTDRFRQFEPVSTFFAFEFVDWHGQPS